ncbi:MAG: hypothetical protein PF486_04495 [Prolixibacteraceae bacterium]|jgi:hypothetical protein|nr:hypothetical protein [Prolixibacteraceae bacterium]
MKKFLIILLISSFSFAVKAQEVAPVFVKGDKVANIGIGLGSGLSSYYKMSIPPISLSAEYGIMDNILEKGSVGVGAYLGFSSYKFSGWGSNYSSRTSRVYIGPRGSFHYPLIDKLDTYAGLSIGFHYYSWSYEDDGIDDFYDYNNNDLGVYSYWFIGARYYLTDNLAAMAELGYGITYLNIGISIKL